MKSMSSLSIAVAALLAGSSVVATNPGLPVPDYQGCYTSVDALKYKGTNMYQSMDRCQIMCGQSSVEATTNGNACWCGNSLPLTKDLVDDSQCNLTCTGFGSEKCGGSDTFSVYLSGLGKLDTSPSSSSTSSSTSTTSATHSVVTVDSPPVVVTSGPTSTASPKPGPNKAAIAAGVVVGLIALAGAVGGGIYFYMRGRRNRQVEEEYRRNAAVSEFVAGGKTHTSSNGSFSDTRLDPTVMAQRRMSDGSIADNQDYSRRILKVTNA